MAWASPALADNLNLRVVNWNIFNRPNSAQDEVDARAILDAINQETVNGLADGIDILALQETDTGGTQSYQKTLALLNSLGDGSFAGDFSSASGGGDRTAIIYDTTELTRLSSVSISGLPGQTNPHTRTQFRPVGSTDPADDLYVYSLHLTSGGGAAGRASEMTALLNNADALGPDANILFVGDLNVRNFESAYTQPLGPGNASFNDPWVEDGNAAFSPAAFTQDPRPGRAFDDRFDLQLASTEFFDDALLGWEYLDGSYRAFGNGPDYAALRATGVFNSVSDHLPVVADYGFFVPEPAAAWLIVSGLAMVVGRRRRVA